MKHAYLILAHQDFEVLTLLLNALDDIRNDIYIHFDKKVKHPPFLSVSRARLYIIESRINISWGDVSMVEAEYALFEAATSRLKYEYYHLLSGVDFPLKSQDEIHDFFRNNKGKEFIGFYQKDCRKDVDRKVKRIHLFPKKFRSHNIFNRIIRAFFLRLQFCVGYRKNSKIVFKKGTQWGSYTDEFVKFLLEEKKKVLHIYKNTFCSDEIYKQTLCWNSKFKSAVYNEENEEIGAMRLISWKAREMLSWTLDDYGLLVKSNLIFARKFSTKNIDLVKKLSHVIRGEAAL